MTRCSSPSRTRAALTTWIAEAALWSSLIARATWFGGTLYQMIDVVPMWASAPPDSVHWFFTLTRYNDLIFGFFGPPFMAARTIPLVISLACSWRSRLH